MPHLSSNADNAIRSDISATFCVSCFFLVLEGFDGKGRNWVLRLLMVHVPQGQDRHDTALDNQGLSGAEL